ncbi:hypothetical protein AeRB84_006675 [Aphanomyces euteiches]|nr:hypothetical protein AeRB84_006675 [Aphanomyces euteiches]
MGIESLAPANSKRARENAVRSFMLFLNAEGVKYDYVKECLMRDSAAQCIIALLDKFGMHLAFKDGRQGKPLVRHSVMQYFRQAKNWLLDQYPLHRIVVETRLLQMGRTLEKYCIKRESGGFTNKATACSKSSLSKMCVYMYKNGSSSSDYHDAALLCLLWHLFGRASDVTQLRRNNVSISAGDVLFVRFIRMKTSEEQGLSLMPDVDYTTCPILAIALALASQVAPSSLMFPQLPAQQANVVPITPATPLMDVLDDPTSMATIAPDNNEGLDSGRGVHNYVNRLLESST